MSKLRFLVVEDSPAMRRVIINTLSRIVEADILEAENGLEALDQLKVEKIDFILVDWLMPMMDGLDFVKAVKGSDTWKNIPVVMITTKGLKSDIVLAITTGVDDYIVKPVNANILDTKIKKILLEKGIKI